MSVFVYVSKDILLSSSQKILKNEIGILIEENDAFSYVQFVNYDNIIKISTQYIHRFDPYTTGDQFAKKVCNRCNRLLPTEMFQKNQNGKNNRTVRRPSCIDCREGIDGKSVSSKAKKQWERTKPNMVIWECPICKKRTIPGLTSKVVLDHNHVTGEPRAWICDSCNTGLGRFKDDVIVMESADRKSVV